MFLPSTVPQMLIPVLLYPVLLVSFTLINHSMICLHVCLLLVTRKHNAETVSTVLEAMAPLVFLVVFLRFLFCSSSFTTLYLSIHSSLQLICYINWPHLNKRKKNNIFFKVFWVCITSLLQSTVQPPSTHTHAQHTHIYTCLIKWWCKAEEGENKRVTFGG